MSNKWAEITNTYTHTYTEKKRWPESIKQLRINTDDAKRAAFIASQLSQDICVSVCVKTRLYYIAPLSLSAPKINSACANSFVCVCLYGNPSAGYMVSPNTFCQP